MLKTTIIAVSCVLIGSASAAEAPREVAVERAVFAGGCFWCMQPAFDRLPGVVKTTVGYTGGDTQNPTYEEVSSGLSGHVEAIEVLFDPARVSYEALLEVYWRSLDPTDGGGQFADRGSQYRPVIFYADDSQRERAERSRAALEKSGKFSAPIAVTLEPACVFWPAEDYHQSYYRKSSVHYQLYKRGSGRAGFLERTWGEPREEPPKDP
jgi:peptide-methionine (S)-S-oxide reductase